MGSQVQLLQILFSGIVTPAAGLLKAPFCLKGHCFVGVQCYILVCYIQFGHTMKNDQTTELPWSIEFYVM